jgi:hypothetical protein
MIEHKGNIKFLTNFNIRFRGPMSGNKNTEKSVSYKIFNMARDKNYMLFSKPN